MQEKIDGTFGEIAPLRELFEKLEEQNFIDATRAIHFGTPEQLEKVKAEKDIYHRLDELSERLDRIEEKDKPSIFWKPTKRQIKIICNQANDGLK